MPRIINLIDEEAKLKLYKFTKHLIQEHRDVSIREIMKHDSYKRIKGRIRQVGWSK